MNFYLYFVLITGFKFISYLLYNLELFIDRDLPNAGTYDYIVVGSGSSGGIIGTNLKGKVLLIDAGGYGSTFLFNIPIIQPLLLRSEYDFKHETIEQKSACKGLGGNKSFWPSGKIISGTHRLNNMIYHRGHPIDYRGFFENPKDAEEYFEANEDFIPVSETNFKSSVSHAFIEAGRSLGFDDFNYTNLTQKYGRRFTSIYNWWTKTAEPPETILNAIVTKILFSQRTAIGIEFIKRHKKHKVFGKKIILAAGTMGSPKILLHSGIGPKDHLIEMDIDVVENLPVGRNLQDHVTTFIDVLMNTSAGCTIKDILNPFTALNYFYYGNGPLSFAGSDAMGFVSFNSTNEIPDISFILIPLSIVDDYGLHLRKVVNIDDEIWSNYYEPLAGQSLATILPILLHPESQGYLQLKSKNVLDPLHINPNYYSKHQDIMYMMKAIRIAQKLIETPAMKALGAELLPKKLPGCENHPDNSDTYWECYIKHLTLTMYHPVGTCKLGDYNDDSTVVLKNFQIKNINNLYVVDGSIIPTATTANPHALISMLAHKFTHQMNSIFEAHQEGN